MKIQFGSVSSAAILAALTSMLATVVFFEGQAVAGVSTTVTNGITMQVGLMSGEPPLGPSHNIFNQNMMAWQNSASHPYTPGYWRPDPSSIIPNQDMWRTWDVVFSTDPAFHLWDCVASPTGTHSGEYGTMLIAPLIISIATGAFNPTNLWYQCFSGDFYHSFSGIGGQLAFLNKTTNLQSWSTTCVGVLVANGVTNIYTNGPMNTPVSQIYYSGVTFGYGVTDGSNNPGGSGYASNYMVGYWPFDISATYTLMDGNGTNNTNVVCRGTALLDSQFHWHMGNGTTNISLPGLPLVVWSVEAWDNRLYTVDTFTLGFTNEVFFGTMGDNDVIYGTNSFQFFRTLPTSSYRLASKALGKKIQTPPPVAFYQ